MWCEAGSRATKGRTALFVSYYFPPLGGPGVYRPLKLCKYLPEWGWTTAVVAADDPQYEHRDETLLAQVPLETPVYRAKGGVPWHGRLCEWLARRRGLWRLGAPVRSVFAFPDEKVDWGRRAYRRGMQAIHDVRPDVIFTTSYPFATHLVGLRLKQATRIPWVADFRDPWADGPMHMAGLSGWTVSRHRALEHRVARTADHLTLAHPLAAESFQARHQIPAEKVSCLTNGFDPEDFEGWTFAPTSRSRIRIVHLGTFYGPYNPAPLKRALALAAEKRPGLLEQIRLVFVGGTNVPFDDIAGLEVEVTGRLAQGDALRRLREGDVALNVYERATGKHNISTKLFEYLAAGRPILAIVPEDGTTAEIVRRCSAGFVADPDRPSDVLAAIERCIEVARGRVPFAPRREEVRRFSRHELAGDLSRILDRLTTRQTGEKRECFQSR